MCGAFQQVCSIFQHNLQGVRLTDLIHISVVLVLVVVVVVVVRHSLQKSAREPD